MNPLFSYGFLIFGAYVAVYGRYHARLAARSLSWPRTNGTVVRSEVVASGGAGRGYEARVEYRYCVGGREYRGKTLSIGGQLGTTAKLQQQRCDAYPVGSEATVFYDANKPEQCTLERNSDGASFVSLVGICFAVIGLLGAVGIVG